MSDVLFPLSAFVYLIATILYEVYLTRRSPWAGRWATRSLVVGVLAQALALVFRWLQLGSAPIGSLAESLYFFAWFIIILYLIVEYHGGQKVLGAFVSPTAFAAVAAASLLCKRAKSLSPIMQSYWLPIHVTISFVAYGFFALAFAVSVVYLLAAWQLKKGRPGYVYYRLPPLETMEQLGRALAALGLPFMTVALITGSIWAEKVWGSPWLWDAKLNLSLATWLIYVIHFYVRNVRDWRGRRSAWLLILGFIFVLVTYLGVNLFMPTVHGFIVTYR